MTTVSRRGFALLAVLVVVLAGLATAGTWLASRSWHASATIGSDPADRQVSLGNQVPAGAVVDAAHQRVRLTGSRADLVFVASPTQGPDLAFRMAGLTNPTVVVPAGTKVSITLVNADEEMQHDWLLARAAPPYPRMGMMMLAPSFPGAATAMLPEAGGNSMPTQTVSFVANQAGTYHYLCAYPDHAAGGMYGTLVVQGS